MPQDTTPDAYHAQPDEAYNTRPHPEINSRLRACARIVMRQLAGLQTGDKNFTFFNAVHEFEERIIEWALEEARGSVVRAARLLGIRHQTFSFKSCG
jgi:DNA-binding NtrC family response regulator